MLTIPPEKIYISSANVDMRKSIDGLSAIVEQNFKLNQLVTQCLCFTTGTAISTAKLMK